MNVILDVPAELDNEFQSEIGYLDWEFMIEEFPIEKDDPKPPKTGDHSAVGWWFAIMICSLAIFIILLIWRQKEKEKEN